MRNCPDGSSHRSVGSGWSELGSPMWILLTGPKTAKMLAKPRIPSFIRHVRQDSVVDRRRSGDPHRFSAKPLMNNTISDGGWVPTGADRDPCASSIFEPLQYFMAREEWVPL